MVPELRRPAGRDLVVSSARQRGQNPPPQEATGSSSRSRRLTADPFPTRSLSRPRVARAPRLEKLIRRGRCLRETRWPPAGRKTRPSNLPESGQDRPKPANCHRYPFRNRRNPFPRRIACSRDQRNWGFLPAPRGRGRERTWGRCPSLLGVRAEPAILRAAVGGNREPGPPTRWSNWAARRRGDARSGAQPDPDLTDPEAFGCLWNEPRRST